MKDKLKELECLQSEEIDKLKIILAIYTALAAFSVTGILRLVTLPNESYVVIAASSLFTVSTISFLLIVLSIQHVLNKNKDLHLGHILASEKFSKTPRLIGISCLLLGFLLFLFYISIITFLIGLVAISAAMKHHSKFVEKMNTYSGAREALKRTNDEI